MSAPRCGPAARPAPRGGSSRPAKPVRLETLGAATGRAEAFP